MPWELTIIKINPNDASRMVLGEKETLRAIISKSLAGTEWRDGPPQREMVELLEKSGMSSETIEIIKRPKLKGVFEGPNFSLEFYGFESQPITEFGIDVRGNGDPLPALAALCKDHQWTPLDPQGIPIDLGSMDASSWESFKSYRDRAIAQVLNDNRKSSES
jgi:hypothetical protein